MDFVKAEEPLALELYLTQAGYEGNSLIASLTDYELAEDEKIWADIYWSLDNLNFQKETKQDGYWCELAAGTKLYRPCLLQNHEALANYLDGIVDTLYVKMEVHSSLGFSKWTEVAVLEKPLPGENVMSIKEMYPGIPLHMMMGSFRNRYAQYHITVTENENGYDEVLPQTIPVAFNLVPEQKLPYGDSMMDLMIPYDVFWEESEDTEYTYVAVNMQNRIEEDYFFVAGNQNFCIEKSLFPLNLLEELSQMRMNHWYCTVHPVPQGYATELTLAENTDTGILSAQLPLKPTGMTRIEIEVSTDGEENWRMMDVIKAEENPVDYMPKEEGYRVRILSKEKVERLLSEGTGTFHVRLKIVNGPLGNKYALEGSDDTYTYSQSAVWTGPYVELPPEEDSEDKEDNTGDDTEKEDSTDTENGTDKDDGTDVGNGDDSSNKDDDFSAGNDDDENGGSGGNNGNVGADNSGDTNGQRPGVDTSLEGGDAQIPPVTPGSPSNDASNEENENTQTPPVTPDIPSEDESSGDNENSQTPPINSDRPSDDKTDGDNGNVQLSPEKPDDSSEGTTGGDGNTQPSLENPGDSTDEDSENTQPSSENSENVTDGTDEHISDTTAMSGNSDSRNKKVTAIAASVGIVAAGCAVTAVFIKLGMLSRLLDWITKRKHR